MNLDDLAMELIASGSRAGRAAKGNPDLEAACESAWQEIKEGLTANNSAGAIPEEVLRRCFASGFHAAATPEPEVVWD